MIIFRLVLLKIISMKNKIKHYQKTDHFLYRQWDRGVNDYVVSEIIKGVTGAPIKKTLFIAGKTLLKKLGLTKHNPSYLVIVAKSKTLITLFFVNDLFAYLKSVKGRFDVITL